MVYPDFQNLKYGTIYIYGDPLRMTVLHRATDLLRKIVYPMDLEWIDDLSVDGAQIVARRFNVGNIGRYATVSLRTSQYNHGGGQMKALHRFTDVLMSVSDPTSGDVVIDEDDFDPIGSEVQYNIVLDEYDMPCAAPQDKTRVEKPRELHRFRKNLKDKFNFEVEESMVLHNTQVSGDLLEYIQQSEPDKLQEEEDLELAKMERDRELALERIRHEIVNYIALYHDDPKELMAELLRGKVIVGQPGRLLINGDMRIVLPEYDEMEIQMPALCRTLYILFLKHRKMGGDGIVLKNIDRYRDEILDIYGLVKPGANDRRVRQSVDNLCDPLSESLNQTISKINRCIRNVITGAHLADNYCITGVRGQRYGIMLDPQYLELPRAVTGA